MVSPNGFAPSAIGSVRWPMTEHSIGGLSGDKVHAIREILRDPRVQRVVLFGSRAKGNYRAGSDIDLAVCGDRLSATDILRLRAELEEALFPWAVDLVHWTESLSPELAEHIRRVGITLDEPSA